jgi:hypothetical protein
MEYLQTQQEFNKSGCFRKMQNKFFQICDEIKEEFCDKLSDIVWKRKGVFFTEALAFIAMCRLHKIDTIIESGVRNGDSTEMWLKYFGDDIELYSVDLMEHKDDVSAAVNRLSQYKNLTFKQGDGEKVVPGLVHTLKNRNIALFLDGPKEFGAMRITQRCFSVSEDVKFSSIHDMGNGALMVSTKPSTIQSINVMRGWYNFVFDTDNEEFRKKYSFVDRELGGENNPEWIEYKNKYPIGCGLAFIENR